MPIKLRLKGYINDTPHHSYHHWPQGTTMRVIENDISAFKKAFRRVSVLIEYAYDDL